MAKTKFNLFSVFKKTSRALNIRDNFKVIIFCLSLVSLLSYLVVVNDVNTKGYEIAKMQMQIQELNGEHRDLQSKTTLLQSLPRIKEISSSQLNMVLADNFDYVLVKGPVAKKD